MVVQTPRTRIIVMSISGLSLRTSTRIQARMKRTPTRVRPNVFAETQPQVVVSLIASSTAERPIVISAAASQLTRPGVRTGDSGTSRQVATAATTIATSGQPEEPVVVEVLDDHPREHDPDAAADAEDRREQADAARHLLVRELVADDPEGEREDAAADALDEAGE